MIKTKAYFFNGLGSFSEIVWFIELSYCVFLAALMSITGSVTLHILMVARAPSPVSTEDLGVWMKDWIRRLMEVRLDCCHRVRLRDWHRQLSEIGINLLKVTE